MSHLTGLSDEELERYKGRIEAREREILNSGWPRKVAILVAIVFGLAGVGHLVVKGLQNFGATEILAAIIAVGAFWYLRRAESEELFLQREYANCVAEWRKRYPSTL